MDTSGVAVVSNPMSPVVILGPIGVTVSKMWNQPEEEGEDPV
jgi:hypothetical protein